MNEKFICKLRLTRRIGSVELSYRVNGYDWFKEEFDTLETAEHRFYIRLEEGSINFFGVEIPLIKQ